MSTTWKRPKLQIPKLKSEWIWDVIGFTFYVGSVLFLIYVWNKLPEQVPAHYNAKGEIDRWGSKWELIIFPVIGGFLGVFMWIIEKFPEVHNYPKRLNESNAAQFYLNSRKIVNQIKNICLILFAFIQYESISIALKWGGGFGVWFLPVLIIATLIPIVIGIMKLNKIK